MSDKHPITVVKNGIETRLDSLAHGIVTKSGVHTLPGVRDGNAEIPGRTGVVYWPGKRSGPGAVYLQMYVQECDEYGYVPPDAYPKFLENLDRLFFLFSTKFKQIAIREYLDEIPATIPGSTIAPDPSYAKLYSPASLATAPGYSHLYLPGSLSADISHPGLYELPEGRIDQYNYREAICDVNMMIAPELSGRYWSKFSVECIITDGSWREKNIQTITVCTAPGTYSIPGLAGMTEDIEDAIICLDGPIGNPKLIDPVSGHYIQLSGAVNTGQQWVIDCGTWQSVVGSGLNFTTVGGTNRTGNTTSVGPFAPRLFGIAADVVPQITLVGTGTDGNTRLRIKARRRYK